MPLYMLGFMGATRRLDHYDASTGWHPLFLVAAFGAFLMFCGACIQIYGLFASLRNKENIDQTGDPWNGRTLEWSIPSPPPVYNFAVVPRVNQRDPLWAIKRGHVPRPEKRYEDIEMPRNTAVGLYIGVLSLFFGFAITWHIWWMVIASFVGIAACVIVCLSGEDKHDIIPAEEVKQIEEAHLREVHTYE